MADPIHAAVIRCRRGDVTTDHVLALCDEVERLRSKVVEALDWAEKHQAEVDRLRAALTDAIAACIEDGAWAAEQVMRRALEADRGTD